MSYKHLFFDLDHTIWDFDSNAKSTLEDVYYQFDLRQFGVIDPNHFIDTYIPINDAMWRLYRRGQMNSTDIKIKRFQETLKKFGVIDQKLVVEVKEFYLDKLPTKGMLLPNAIETLEYLKDKYVLHIVTNGFHLVSNQKIDFAAIGKYFKSVLSAEKVGVLKPNPKVFETALLMNNAIKEESLFIGDSLEADVKGAMAFGMDQVFYNPYSKAHAESPTYEIKDLVELTSIL